MKAGMASRLFMDGCGKADSVGFVGSSPVCTVKGVGLQWVQFPPGNWVAPAGSNRSGGGGNEAVGAFGETGHSSGSASRRP